MEPTSALPGDLQRWLLAAFTGRAPLSAGRAVQRFARLCRIRFPQHAGRCSAGSIALHWPARTPAAAEVVATLSIDLSFGAHSYGRLTLTGPAGAPDAAALHAFATAAAAPIAFLVAREADMRGPPGVVVLPRTAAHACSNRLNTLMMQLEVAALLAEQQRVSEALEYLGIALAEGRAFADVWTRALRRL